MSTFTAVKRSAITFHPACIMSMQVRLLPVTVRKNNSESASLLLDSSSVKYQDAAQSGSVLI